MNAYLQTKRVEDGHKRAELRISLTPFNGHQRVESHTRQVCERLLIHAQMLPAFLDNIPNFFRIHLTICCDFAAKVCKRFVIAKKIHNKL